VATAPPTESGTTSGIDLDDIKLEEALKRYLDPNDPMFKKVEYRGLCLIGFDSDAYPATPNSKEMQQVRHDVESAFEKRRHHIHQRLSAEKIDSFDIEVFCLPFPSVDDFRQAFRIEIGLSDGHV